MRGEGEGEGARELVDGGAAHRVGEEAWRGAARVDRREVDDGAVGGTGLLGPGDLDHPAGDDLGQAQGGGDVLGEGRLEAVALGAERVAGLEDAARVDEDVDAVVGLEGGGDEVGHRQLLAEVAGEGLDAARVVHLADGAGLALEADLVDVGADDKGPGADEALGDGETDAARRAGHDHRLSREVAHMSPPAGTARP